MAIYLIERVGDKLTRGKYKGKRKVRFYLVHYTKGSSKRVYEKLPIGHIAGVTKKSDKKKLAQEILTQRKALALSKSHGVLPKNLDKINFCSYAENYLNSYKKKDVRMIERAFKHFKRFLELNEKGYPQPDLFMLKDLEKDVCIDYGSYLLNDAGLNGETPYNYFARFKKIITQIVRENLLPENPINLIEDKDKVKKPKKHDQTLNKEVLNIDEIKKLIGVDCGNDEVKRAFIFACFTGLGYAECKALKWENIKNDKLDIKRTKSEIPVNNNLSSTAKKILDKCDKNSEFIFNLPSFTSTLKTLSNWVKRAGIEKHITFHCGRHTAAVLFLIEGKVDLLTVSKLLGHASTDHTIKYLNYVDESKKKAIDNMPNVDF